MDPLRPACSGPVGTRGDGASPRAAPASATGVEEAADAVRRALESGEPYRKWLLIFDNAEEPGQIEEFIPGAPATS
nr:hypothetical protein GCM10020093_013660 [Planobispora longispora]